MPLSLDLVASDTQYHKQCKSDFFFTNKDIPGKKDSIKRPGRPLSGNMKETFEKPSDWLDNQTELWTVKELHTKSCSISNNKEETNSFKWVKQKLAYNYGETIVFINLRRG